MAVRRRSNLVRAKSDRQSVWFAVDVSAGIAAGAATQVATLSAAALLFRPFTVVRTRLLINWQSDQAIANETPVGALGMIVVSNEAASAGLASIPDPVADQDSPFFVWQAMISSFLFASGVGFTEPTGLDYVVDSKAMRKVGTNEDVSIMVEEIVNVGANIRVLGRMLVKLH